MYNKKLVLIVVLGIILSYGLSNPGTATPALTGPAEVRIGFPVSIKVTGLTSGTHYACIAAHSDGNVTHPFTATTTTEYCRFTFTTADSDGIVPIHLDRVDATGTSMQIDNPTNNATTYDTMILSLINPTGDIPSSFLQQILPGMVLIGVFVILMSSLLYGLKLKFKT